MNTPEKKTTKKQLNKPSARLKTSSSNKKSKTSSAAASASKQKLHTRRRKRLRQKQVKRQKLFLVGIAVLLVLAALSGIFLPRQRHQGELTINSACESYRPDVEAAAAEYKMSDYVDLILALMMQESSGQGPDVLQSSEGAYNTKYPQIPNGITDADYSIECGIQELKYAMEKAGVRNPNDISRIRLALQAYNFGADSYFSYLEKNGITSWSEETAEAFAQMASGENARSQDDPLYETAGPWDYGDQKYPEHVLRYYHP